MYLLHDNSLEFTYIKPIGFYRPTPGVNAVSLLSPGVCLSVTFVHCIQTAENIVKLLSRPGSPKF